MRKTVEAAKRIVEIIKPELGQRAVIIALSGPLGAGKTAMTKVIARELGVLDEIVSPTYVLHLPYHVSGIKYHVYLNHLDVWRLETWDEAERLGLSKMIEDKSLIVIEWADKFEYEVQRYKGSEVQVIWVEIDYKEGEEREIRIS